MSAAFGSGSVADHKAWLTHEHWGYEVESASFAGYYAVAAVEEGCEFQLRVRQLRNNALRSLGRHCYFFPPKLLKLLTFSQVGGEMKRL